MIGGRRRQHLVKKPSNLCAHGRSLAADRHRSARRSHRLPSKVRIELLRQRSAYRRPRSAYRRLTGDTCEVRTKPYDTVTFNVAPRSGCQAICTRQRAWTRRATQGRRGRSARMQRSASAARSLARAPFT